MDLSENRARASGEVVGAAAQSAIAACGWDRLFNME